MNKQEIYKYIDENADRFIGVSHSVWEYAELSLKEFRSAALYIEKLKEDGFEVETGYAGIETAFSGKFVSGKGKPVIGILGEFDALSGLSQKACALEREETVKNGTGHGCGHNMLGAASYGAACAVKKYLEETGKDGTVIFFGCPGEEGGAAKAFMAREGIWKNLDCALSWHPGTTNEIMTGTNNSCTQVLYKFKGIAAHAAGNPEMGRSALDAVEIMNIGVNYLREHMKSDCRIHYAMVDGGGVSPNVVQPHASVLYMVRSIKVKDTIDLQKRVDGCAKGAAIMTGTTFERIFVDGTANAVPNTTLEKVIYENMKEIPLPSYSEDDYSFAEKLDMTCVKSDDVPGIGSMYNPDIRKEVKELMKNSSEGLNDFLFPFYSGDDFTPGSSDVGDVSWLTPTAQFTAVTFTKNSPGHSWQNVSAGCSPVGDKGMIYAAKVLAGSAVDLFSNTETIEKAKEEFLLRLDGESYVCPIESDAVPYVIGE
ncbi:MAG: amidohydrolase [Clostridia bacterium]|nr:amidohydrolase [Clostridia bacterium]